MSAVGDTDEQGKLSHIDPSGGARMVDVGRKDVTRREARAEAFVKMSRETLGLVASGGLPKGDAFAVARIAGIGAAKRTSELIPLCHPLRLDSVHVGLVLDEEECGVRVEAVATATERTGVEMEALVAAAAAALALYDMCKSAERGVEVTGLRLMFKSGGKSGTWEREDG